MYVHSIIASDEECSNQAVNSMYMRWWVCPKLGIEEEKDLVESSIVGSTPPNAENVVVVEQAALTTTDTTIMMTHDSAIIPTPSHQVPLS